MVAVPGETPAAPMSAKAADVNLVPQDTTSTTLESPALINVSAQAFASSRIVRARQGEHRFPLNLSRAVALATEKVDHSSVL